MTAQGPARLEPTRARLLQAAARLFTARGYHGVSVREVAQAVGVTKPALYHHYADKEALFLAILDGALHTLTRLVDRAGAHAGLRAQLTILLTDLLASAEEQRVGLGLAGELKHVSAARRADFEARYRRAWLGGVGELIERGVQAGELRRDLPPATLTRALLSLAYPAGGARTDSDPAATARDLVQLFLDGARPQER